MSHIDVESLCFNNNPTPMSRYSQETYVDFMESPQMHKQVKRMAIKMYRKNYPGSRPIIYETDVRDSMCFALDNQFSRTHNLHNLRIDAANRLFHMIVENVYAEEELYDEYVNVKRRVHDITQAQSVASCKNKLKDKCYYPTGNLV